VVCLTEKRKHFQGSCHSWGHSWVRIFTEGKEQTKIKKKQKNKKEKKKPSLLLTELLSQNWKDKKNSSHRGSFLNLHSCFRSERKCPLRLTCFRTEVPVSSMINMYLLQNVRFSPWVCKSLLESPHSRLQCRKEIQIQALSKKQGKLLNAVRFFLFCWLLHCSDIILPCRQVNSPQKGHFSAFENVCSPSPWHLKTHRRERRNKSAELKLKLSLFSHCVDTCWRWIGHD